MPDDKEKPYEEDYGSGVEDSAEEGGADDMIKDPNEKMRAEMTFQRVRSTIRLRLYAMAESYLVKDHLQNRHFEGRFLIGYIKTLNPASTEEQYLEGIGEMLEGCYANIFNRQLLEEMKEALENGIERGFLTESEPNSGEGRKIKPENRTNHVHDLICQEGAATKNPYFLKRLRLLLAELRLFLR